MYDLTERDVGIVRARLYTRKMFTLRLHFSDTGMCVKCENELFSKQERCFKYSSKNEKSMVNNAIAFV